MTTRIHRQFDNNIRVYPYIYSFFQQQGRKTLYFVSECYYEYFNSLCVLIELRTYLLDHLIWYEPTRTPSWCVYHHWYPWPKPQLEPPQQRFLERTFWPLAKFMPPMRLDVILISINMPQQQRHWSSVHYPSKMMHWIWKIHSYVVIVRVLKRNKPVNSIEIVHIRLVSHNNHQQHEFFFISFFL